MPNTNWEEDLIINLTDDGLTLEQAGQYVEDFVKPLIERAEARGRQQNRDAFTNKWLDEARQSEQARIIGIIENMLKTWHISKGGFTELLESLKSKIKEGE